MEGNINMKYKIIAVDLDGTLLSDEKKILPETAAALKKASEMGIEIVPSTGRPFGGIPDFIMNFDFVSYALTCNGAAVYDAKSGRCISEAPLSPEKAAEILKTITSFDISIDAFISGKSYKEDSQKKMIDNLDLSDIMKNYIKSTRIFVDDLTGFILENNLSVQKFTLNFTRDQNGVLIDREKTRLFLETVPDIALVSGGMNNLEITRSGVNKGAALLRLGELLGVPREEIMAFGDSGNDLDMIKAAGFGIAMANSDKEVLSAAGYVTLSNNDNGIAAALERFVF